MSRYKNMRDYFARQADLFLNRASGFKKSKEDSFATRIATKVSRDLKKAQTVIFSSEQVGVFFDISKSYTDSLNYRLPFDFVFLQFTKSMKISFGNEVMQAYGMLLSQYEATEDDRSITIVDEGDIKFKDVRLSEIDGPLYFNSVAVIGVDRTGGMVAHQNSWFSGEELLFQSIDVDKDDMTIPVAIACIGYINCENVYLHREDVPDKVNRKREAKGKSKLEPYYVCRIRGVNYDGNGTTGEGSSHGIRYDVRGHFRRLATGKTTWVRAHQRGLANELYVPKTYLVDKKMEGKQKSETDNSAPLF